MILGGSPQVSGAAGVGVSLASPPRAVAWAPRAGPRVHQPCEGPQALRCSPQPATAAAACATSSRASASARRAPCHPSAPPASPGPSAATRWPAVRSAAARGPASRSSQTPPVTRTAASASEGQDRAARLLAGGGPGAPTPRHRALGSGRQGAPRRLAPREGSRWEAQPVLNPHRCRPNVAGRRCDTCAPGFHGYPSCRPCDCHQAGSAPGVCDPGTGQCYCKVRGGGPRGPGPPCPASSAAGRGFPEAGESWPVAPHAPTDRPCPPDPGERAGPQV